MKLFVLLVSIDEPLAAEENRLKVRLTLSRAQPETPEPANKPPESKPRVAKSPPRTPKPAVKPPANKVAQAAKPPDPPLPERVEPRPEFPASPAAEKIPEPPDNVNKDTEAQPADAPAPVPQATPLRRTVAEVVPLFRLTRMPKVVDYNLESLKRFYPQEERDFGKEATVEAMILVDENGAVIEVEIIKSAGARFDAAARKAILSNALVIQPGYIGDKPVASRVPIPITFNLKD